MYKSPIISIMGHVDAGKTSLISSIKNKDFTKSEYGGITQSINSYYLEKLDIDKFIKKIDNKYKTELNIPSFLFIDTPGHMAFSKMRETSITFCDIAILVIDLLQGIKPQTIECIELLKIHKIPFIIVTTKMDMVDGYNKTNHTDLKNALSEQDKETKILIESYIEDIKYQLNELNIKSEFYLKNKKPQQIYSIVPISCITKEGSSDLLSLLVYISQNWMDKKILYNDEVEMFVTNNYNDKGMGWVIDVILKNGKINVGDRFAVMSSDGPKEIKIRAMIVNYKRISQVKASHFVKIIGSNMNNIYSGIKIIPLKIPNALEIVKNDFEDIIKQIELKQNGISIMAPSLGELMGLYNNISNINISNANIGLLTEKHIINFNLYINNFNIEPYYKCFIYFGHITQKDFDNFNELCNKYKIKFINSEVLYEINDIYDIYYKETLDLIQKKLTKDNKAVYPCILKIFEQHIFMKGGNDNIMLGVKVQHGRIVKGTPICFINNKNNSDKGTFLGNVISIQKNNEEIEEGNEGDNICIRLDNPNGLLYDRHFNNVNKLVSMLTRERIDILKKYYRNKMTKTDWELVIQLKNILNII